MSTTGGADHNGGDEFDGPTAAFRRLLKDVATDERARVDALVVLSQRTVYVATWPTDPDAGIRTLRSSSGDTALPIFSSFDALQEAAQRYGWLSPDGSLCFRELGAREALRRAIARGVQFVVIDIGMAHSVEFARSEVEPLLTANARKDSTGPFAASGKVSTALMDAVRKTSRPPPPAASDVTGAIVRSRPPLNATAAANVQASALKPAGLPSDLSKHAKSFPPERHATGPTPVPAATATATAIGAAALPASRRRSVTPDSQRLTGPLVDTSGMTFRAPTPMPSDDCLDLIADALRRYPEVEWAAVTTASKGDATQLMIVLRVDPGFRTRISDINRHVRLAAEDAGTAVGVAVVDDPLQMRAARNAGLVFFPWKKKKSGT